MEKRVMTDYEKLSQLVLWERQARVRRLQDEPADCYWEDATVTTSWSSGSAVAYLNRGNSGNHRSEACDDEVIINRSVAPLIHYNGGNRAYAELPKMSGKILSISLKMY